MISSTAIFATSDIHKTLTYYKEVLGFESTWAWGHPPTFGSASRAGVTVMFNLQPDLAAKVRGHQHWIKVDDADELYKVHLSSGARIVQGIEDKPWNAREYVVEDLNGYHLRFAGPPSGTARPSQAFPEGVTIERGKPNEDDYARVAGAAFGHKRVAPGLMENTWNGVLARSPEGETIGMLRIMQDAPGWFSVWDVAVVPEWQARRIGTKMMTEALAMVREDSPGAIVHLFTYQYGFYERLGFAKETASLLRL